MWGSTKDSFDRHEAWDSQKHYSTPFNLREGETVTLIIKPNKAKFMTKYLAIAYIVLGILLVPLAFPSIFPTGLTVSGGVLLFVLVPVFVVVFGLGAFAISNLVYERLTFWITNKRIINSSGFIGYTVHSIPIYIITDVVIHQGFFDMILGSTDLLMPTINDNIYNLYKHRSGLNHIPCLDAHNAKELQRTIFDLRDAISEEKKPLLHREYFVA